MTGKQWDISDRRLAEVLRTEFGVIINYRKKFELERIKRALFVYKDRRDFLEQSRWGYDNPELADEKYLIQNRICRWIDGRFVYFSRLVWGEEE